MPKKEKTKVSKKAENKPKCGLCGKSRKALTKTDCCDNWICDDWSDYQMFSYARNSCSRNHERYTLCGSHFNEEHKGDWQECQKCRDSFETEMYVYYGTNEYNFVKLANPPEFEPTRCAGCSRVIDLGNDGYMQSNEGYFCGKCSDKKFRERMKNL